MISRWADADAAAAVERFGERFGETLALRVYSSRLLGAEPGLVLHGGGNTSVKGTAHTVTGRAVEALFIKGSGWDLATIEPPGFPACRLAPLRELAALPRLSDEAMVKGLRAELLDPDGPTPSVEALLHALLPAPWVDHTHASAVLALIDQPDAAERMRALYGDEALFVPYVMPGFDLCRAVAGRLPELEGRSLMVLERHGLFSWGGSARESYERMIDAVARAEAALGERPYTALPHGSGSEHPPPPAPAAAEESAPSRSEAHRALSLAVRGAVARAPRGRRMVALWRRSPAIDAALARDDAQELFARGTATPDHVLRLRPSPAWVTPAEGAAAAVAALEDFGESYRAWFAAHRGERALTELDALPRVVMAPGLGALTLGATPAEARMAGDLVEEWARVILDAERVGRFSPVSPQELFDVEYWSLEQAKLKVGARPPGALAGRVALVTGGASGIGLATATLFAEQGASVLLADKDALTLGQAVSALRRKVGARVASALGDFADAGAAERVVDAAVDAFGGLDLVVSNAGIAPSGLLHEEAGAAALGPSLELNLLAHQRVARAATRVFLAQGLGGCLLFNASKSAFAPGPAFGPYAVAKAALVALMRQYAIDLGAHGVRSNAVNADRIRTGLFGNGVLEARAHARGLTPEAYFQQNLLSRETTAEDVASAFAWLATAEATTGAVITVDGGNAAAFPR